MKKILVLLVLFDLASLIFLSVYVVTLAKIAVAKIIFEQTNNYHRSAWDEYVPDVERSIVASTSLTKVMLDRVYGGVVPHHVPTTIPQLVTFYSRLKEKQDVKNFIIIGPDHTDAGKAAVTVSGASFFTAYGEVKKIDALPSKLQKARLANIEEAPFSLEHSIGSQILIISKIFPNARVTPIILRSDTSKDQAKALGAMLASELDDSTVLIASVDFSHYLSTNQALPLDKVSEEIVRNLDLEASPLVKADSSKSMIVFMKAMFEKKAFKSDSVTVLNTNDLMQNSDYTTGYVFGMWGSGSDMSSTTVTSPAGEGSMIFVGDLMLSRSIGMKMSQKGSWTYPFLEAADFLKSADLTIGNLEGPISERGSNAGSLYSFRANPKSIDGLLYAGFDILSIANNHIWDYGKDAFLDTLDILTNNNIAYIGGGRNFTDAHISHIRDVQGTKVAFLAYTNLLPSFLGSANAKPSVASYDAEQLKIDIRKAKSKADVVVVSFHWGSEYDVTHNLDQEKFAHVAIDAGANLIVGHHPHVVQDIEKYNDGYIAYSLGNFVFDQNFSDETAKGLAIKVYLKNKKIDRLETYDVNFNSSYQPIIRRSE